jgi:hypothetical protein
VIAVIYSSLLTVNMNIQSGRSSMANTRKLRKNIIFLFMHTDQARTQSFSLGGRGGLTLRLYIIYV